MNTTRSMHTLCINTTVASTVWQTPPRVLNSITSYVIVCIIIIIFIINVPTRLVCEKTYWSIAYIFSSHRLFYNTRVVARINTNMTKYMTWIPFFERRTMSHFFPDHVLPTIINMFVRLAPEDPHRWKRYSSSHFFYKTEKQHVHSFSLYS